jgi:hypothetical protein
VIRVDSTHVSTLRRNRQEYPGMRKVKANLEFLVKKMKKIAEFRDFVKSLEGRVQVIKKERDD